MSNQERRVSRRSCVIDRNIFCEDSETDARKGLPSGTGCRMGILVQSMGSSKGVTAKKTGYAAIRRKILIIFLLSIGWAGN